jgi:hypothetical protein
MWSGSDVAKTRPHGHAPRAFVFRVVPDACGSLGTAVDESHEARDGLVRAWLAILAERHPHAKWVPAHNTGNPQTVEAEDKELATAA